MTTGWAIFLFAGVVAVIILLQFSGTRLIIEEIRRSEREVLDAIYGSDEDEPKSP
jgi:hypothetical protein